MKKYIISILFTVSFLLTTSQAFAAVIIPPEQITVEQCKTGGWEYLSYNGVVFKNQGDCVSFVVTDGKNLPDGAVVGEI